MSIEKKMSQVFTALDNSQHTDRHNDNVVFVQQKLYEIINESQELNHDPIAGIETIKRLLKLQPDLQITFIRAFLNSIDNVLIVAQNSTHAKNAENIIDFITEIIVDFIQGSDNNEDYHLIYRHVLSHLIENHRANYDTVRYRICQMLHKIFDLLTSNSQIDGDIFDRLKEGLLERIRDTNEQVQLEAVEAISYLQDPHNAMCAVINGYMFLLKQFSCLISVRLKILSLALINQKSLSIIKDLIYDESHQIRMACYDILIDKIRLKHFSEDYRLTLVRRLLHEDEYVSQRLLKLLLTKWLSRDLSNNFLKLISNLNILKLNGEEADAMLKLLGFLYEKYDYETLEDMFVSNFELKYDFNLYELDVYSAFYYRSLVFHIYSRNDDRVARTFLRYNLQEIFVNLKILINDYINTCDESSSIDEIKKSKQLFIIKQLFHVLSYNSKHFDKSFTENFTDYLGHLICDTKIFDENLFRLILNQFELIEKNPQKLITIYFELISFMENCELDVIDIESDVDSFSVRHRLLVLCQIFSNEAVNKMTKEIDTKLQELILPCVGSKNPKVRMYAIRALGLSCLLSFDLAISYMALLAKMIQLDQPDVVIEAQKALFNIFLLQDINLNDLNDSQNYSLNSEDDGLTALDTNSSHLEQYKPLYNGVLAILFEQFQNNNNEIKLTVCEGFAKLYLAKRLNDLEILSMLLLTLYDPTLDKQSNIKPCLLKFFRLYSKSVKDTQVFEELFVPFIEFLLNVPPLSKYARVNFKDLAKYYCFLILHDDTSCYAQHDTILVSILTLMRNELINENSFRFDRLLNFLLDFSSYKQSRKRRTTTLESIMNLSQEIILTARQKRMHVDGNFKGFVESIKANYKNTDDFVSNKRKHNTQANVVEAAKRSRLESIDI